MKREGEQALLSVGKPAETLHTFYRWGWVPLVAGCAAIVLVVIVSSELLLDYANLGPRPPVLRAIFAGRAVVTSGLLALWAGWYVLRSRRRIEAVREQLRAQQTALAEQAWRAEQVLGLGALSRVLAHEIRGPLHALALDCTRLRKHLPAVPPPLTSKLGELGASIEEQVERLDGLLQDYMEYSHLPGEAHQPQPVNLPLMVEKVLGAHQRFLEEKGVALEVQVPPTLPPLAADPVGLRQLLHLLVRNAVDAAVKGGAVRVKAEPREEGVFLSVSYDGPRVEQPDAVFRPFFSAHRGASGLALAIVRDVARAHGGEVSARAGAAGGLEISVRLPREAA